MFKYWFSHAMIMALLLIAGIGTALLPADSYAQGAPPAPGNAPQNQQQPAAGECTTNSAFSETSSGILTNVLDNVKDIVSRASQNLYTGILESTAFMNAVYAAMVLYIVIFGVMFLLGMANLTLSEVVVRLFKIGFILTIISGPGWGFFHNTVYNFFENGTNEIINAMSAIMANTSPNQAGSGTQGTLAGLDRTLSAVFSMHMFVSILGSVRMFPYGPIFVLLIGYGIWQFLRAIFEAVWVYLMSMIGRALLFGLAPIFIACLMFQKTKALFDGWLNQIINFCLQPIFLFAFLGFYTDLIEKSLRSILNVHWCWGSAAEAGNGGSWGGWTAAVGGTLVRQVWGVTGANLVGADGKVLSEKATQDLFPIDIIDVLIFCLLAQLAWRYTQVVVSIAREIAGSVVSLANMSGALTGWFQQAEGATRAGAQGFFQGATLSSGGARINTTAGIKGMQDGIKAFRMPRSR